MNNTETSVLQLVLNELTLALINSDSEKAATLAAVYQRIKSVAATNAEENV